MYLIEKNITEYLNKTKPKEEVELARLVYTVVKELQVFNISLTYLPDTKKFRINMNKTVMYWEDVRNAVREYNNEIDAYSPRS